MMTKSVAFSALMAAVLSAPAVAFMPSSRPSHAAARKSSLSMSSALIVQNKGGGHGELGKLSYQMIWFEYAVEYLFMILSV